MRKERALARRKSRTLTEVELEFMQVVWNLGEVRTEDVMDALNRRGHPLADGSVRKVLSILGRKGYVSRRREGRWFIYQARMPQEKAKTHMVTDLLKRAFEGNPALMVASLVDSHAVSNKDLETIRRLISERQREERK